MIKQHYNKIIKYDLLNKFRHNNSSELPTIKKITLTFKCKDISLQRLSIILLSLELISLKKGSFQISKTSNILLKIQKGVPCGGKIIMKNTAVPNFLDKLISNIFPTMKNVAELETRVVNKNSFSYRLLPNSIVSLGLQEQYPLFNNLPELVITFTTTARSKQELLFLIKSFQLPVENTKDD